MDYNGEREGDLLFLFTVVRDCSIVVMFQGTPGAPGGMGPVGSKGDTVSLFLP